MGLLLDKNKWDSRQYKISWSTDSIICQVKQRDSKKAG